MTSQHTTDPAPLILDVDVSDAPIRLCDELSVSDATPREFGNIVYRVAASLRPGAGYAKIRGTLALTVDGVEHEIGFRVDPTSDDARSAHRLLRDHCAAMAEFFADPASGCYAKDAPERVRLYRIAAQQLTAAM